MRILKIKPGPLESGIVESKDMNKEKDFFILWL